MRYEIRELGVGGILDQAIAVTKDHFWLFVKIVAVLFLPLNLVNGWVVASSVAGAQAGDMSFTIWLPVLGLANVLVIYPLTNAAMIYAVASSYLDRPITLGLAFRRAGTVFLPLLGTVSLLGLVLMAGFLLLVVPFFIFLFWFFLTVQIVVLEGLSGRAAMSRSRVLMKGNFVTAFVLAILVWVIGLAAGGMQGLIPQLEVRMLVNAVLQSVLFIFAAAAWVVFYFSCRAKAEHFDLALLADAVGSDDEASSGTLDVSPGEAH